MYFLHFPHFLISYQLTNQPVMMTALGLSLVALDWGRSPNKIRNAGVSEVVDAEASGPPLPLSSLSTCSALRLRDFVALDGVPDAEAS